MADEHDEHDLHVVDVEVPGASFSFPATPRTVVLIWASFCAAVVLCVGLIFVEASAANIETFGGLIRAPKPVSQAAPPQLTMGGDDGGRGKLEPP